MAKFRYWRGLTITTYWHKGTRFAVTMAGRFERLDDMAAAVDAGAWYVVRVTTEN